MFPVALVSLAMSLTPPITFRPDYHDTPLTEIVDQIERRSRSGAVGAFGSDTLFVTDHIQNLRAIRDALAEMAK